VWFQFLEVTAKELIALLDPCPGSSARDAPSGSSPVPPDRNGPPALGNPAHGQSASDEIARHRHHQETRSNRGAWQLAEGATDRNRAQNPLPGAATRRPVPAPPHRPASKNLSAGGCPIAWAPLRAKSWPLGASEPSLPSGNGGGSRHRAGCAGSGVRAAGSLAEGRRSVWAKGARPNPDGPGR